MYFTLKSELTAFPDTEAVANSGTDLGDKKTLAEAFSFETGGLWREVDVLVDTGSNVDTMEGEIGGQGIVNRVNFQVLGAGATQREWVDEILSNSGCVIALLVDKAGNGIVIGNLDDPCYVEAIEGGTGQAPGDVVGFTLTLYSNTGKTSPIYPTSLGISTTAAV